MPTRERKDMPYKRSQKRLSGYQFFLRAVLDEMKVLYPDSSIVLSEVSKLCAETWQNMDERVKRRFQDEAETINDSNCKLAGNKTVRFTGPGPRPKRPLSAFILFCKENRKIVKEGNPELSMGQISTVLSIMWSKSDKESKSKYQQISRNQRETYREEMKASQKKFEEASKKKLEEATQKKLEESSQNKEATQLELPQGNLNVTETVKISPGADGLFEKTDKLA